jgi:hypothetical protein
VQELFIKFMKPYTLNVIDECCEDVIMHVVSARTFGFETEHETLRKVGYVPLLGISAGAIRIGEAVGHLFGRRKAGAPSLRNIGLEILRGGIEILPIVGTFLLGIDLAVHHYKKKHFHEDPPPVLRHISTDEPVVWYKAADFSEEIVELASLADGHKRYTSVDEVVKDRYFSAVQERHDFIQAVARLYALAGQPRPMEGGPYIIGTDPQFLRKQACECLEKISQKTGIPQRNLMGY